MTAPLFHLTPGTLDGAGPGSVLALSGAEGHHAATVLRLGAGENLQLSDTERTRAEAVVTEVQAGQLQVQIRSVTTEVRQVPSLVLVQALAKDRRDLQAIESATELGVDAVIPWQAERSVARWKAGRQAKKHAEWVHTVTTAAKQTRRTSIPAVWQLHTTGQYLAQLCGESVSAESPDPPDDPTRTRHNSVGGRAPGGAGAGVGIPGVAGAGGRAPGGAGAGVAPQGEAGVEVRAGIGVVVLHEAEEVSLHTVLADIGALEPEHPLRELHLVIGPEGGISDREMQRFTQASARTARLGRDVLRSSTAGPAAIAGVQLLLGRWDW